MPLPRVVRREPESARRALERQHEDAVARFAALAAAVDARAWPAEPAPGKWSPAQVTEHVLLSYEALFRELLEGAPMRLRTTWWQRVFLRAVFLPRILRTGRIPAGVRAPRELRPGAGLEPLDQASSIAKLRASARRADEELATRGGSVRVTHPYFGALEGLDVLRFFAIHTAHHAEQLPKRGDR